MTKPGLDGVINLPNGVRLSRLGGNREDMREPERHWRVGMSMPSDSVCMTEAETRELAYGLLLLLGDVVNAADPRSIAEARK